LIRLKEAALLIDERNRRMNIKSAKEGMIEMNNGIV
jgi:hypothetical protein